MSDTHSRHHRSLSVSSSSNHRSRSKSPIPVQTTEVVHRHAGEQTTSPTRLSFNLDGRKTASTMHEQTLPGTKKRHSSSSSISFSNSRKSTLSSRDENKRLSGTLNHRGRHANDWLFGGFSLRDQLAKLWRDDSSDEEDGAGDGRGHGGR